MNKENFDFQMEKIIIIHREKGERPKLLLHSCCAPCSSSCLEKIKDFFDITVYFYNPNMDSEEEFNLRASEQIRLCEELNIKCIVENYNASEFFNLVCGLENEKEGGKRCEKCFFLRLNKTAQTAKEKGVDYFATTLTLSPLKNAEKINGIGREIEKLTAVKYLPSDFKKKSGYQRSIELSKEYNLYRQNYCGCVFSKK